MKSIFDRVTDIKNRVFTDDRILMCNYYTGMREQLLDALEDVKRQLIIVEDKLNEYGCEKLIGEPSNIDQVLESDHSYGGPRYNPDAQWSEKVEFVLRKYKRPMNFTEITDEIVSHEMTIGMTKEEKKVLRDKVRTSLGDTFKKNSTNRKRTPARFVLMPKVNKGDINTYWLAGEDLPGE